MIGVSLSVALDVGRLQFPIKRNGVSGLSEGTKKKFKQKFLWTQETLKMKFAEAVALGQTEELIDDWWCFKWNW